MQGDFSQIELRVLAELAGDEQTPRMNTEGLGFREIHIEVYRVTVAYRGIWQYILVCKGVMRLTGQI